jgi:hypothetical protein
MLRAAQREIPIHNPGGNPTAHTVEILCPPKRGPQNSKVRTPLGALLDRGGYVIAERLRSWTFEARWHYV